MTLMGKDKGVTTEDLLRLAEHNDIRGAKTIVAQVRDAVQSFKSIAGDATVPDQVTDLILRWQAAFCGQ